MTVIKHQHPFDLNWQAAGSSQAVLLTKVSTGGPHPPQFLNFSFSTFFFFKFYLYISFPLIANCTAHSGLLTMAHKKNEKERASKEGLKMAGNPEILKVASGLLSCSLSLPPSAALCATAIEQAEGK